MTNLTNPESASAGATERSSYLHKMFKLFKCVWSFCRHKKFESEGYRPANICWSSRRLQGMSWKRLQHVFGVTILRLPRVFKTSSRPLARRIEDVLQDEKLLRWRPLQDVLKTCLEDVLKTYLEDVFETSWRQIQCLLVVSVSSKSKCVTNKSMFHKSICDKSKANPKCVT